MKNKFDLTVIVCTYNRVKLLERCIESIKSQKNVNTKVIIVNDNSKDKTIEYIDMLSRKDMFVVINNDVNIGPSESKRKALNFIEGDAVIFCDDDDYYTESSFFAEALNILRTGEYDIVLADSDVIDESGTVIRKSILNIPESLSAVTYLNKFQYDFLKPNSTFPAVFNSNLIEKSGIKSSKMINDSSIYLRFLSTAKKIATIKKSIGVYYQHSSNISKNINEAFLEKNIDEKVQIYSEKISTLLTIDNEYWLYKQIELTLIYFSKSNNFNVKFVSRILKKHSNMLRLKYRLLIYVSCAKTRIKVVINKIRRYLP